MLPFLTPKKLAGIIVAQRKKDGTAGESKEEDSTDPELMKIAEEILSAVATKDATKLCKALQSMVDKDKREDKSEAEHSEEP